MNKNEQKHTPTPWILEKPSSYNQISDRLIIRAEDTSRNLWDQICEVGITHTGLMGGSPKANAELIVRAVNSYEPMQQRVQELEDALSRCRSLFVHDKDIHLLSLQYNIIEKIEQALQSSKQL
jgi:hypothetical protein